MDTSGTERTLTAAAGVSERVRGAPLPLLRHIDWRAVAALASTDVATLARNRTHTPRSPLPNRCAHQGISGPARTPTPTNNKSPSEEEGVATGRRSDACAVK